MNASQRPRPPGPRIRLALRYDDVSNGSPPALDAFVCRTVIEAGLAVTAAVIPFGRGPADSRDPGVRGSEEAPLQPDRLKLLHAAGPGHLEIAQHGFDHRAVGQDSAGRPAEFSGQGTDEQRARVERGAVILEGMLGARPSTFVPPWNRYDAGTTRALETLGFRALSAGRDGPPSPTRLRIVPATATIGDLQEAIRAGQRRRGPSTIVGLLHPYDFVELGSRWGRIDRDGWRRLLKWVAACPDVAPATIGDLAAADPGLDAERARTWAEYHASNVRRWVPPASSGSQDRPLDWYPTTEEIGHLARRRLVGAVLLGLAMAGIAGIAGRTLAGLMPTSAGLVAAGLSTLTAGAVWARVRRKGGARFRGLVATLAVPAFSLGMWLSLLESR